MSSSFPSCLLLFSPFFIWLASSQLTQFEQYQMQMMNRMNGRTVQSVAFMMERGHQHTGVNSSQYITFDTTTISNNARLYSEYATFQVQIPGLYYFSYRFVGGNASEPTEVQLRIVPNATGVITTYATAVTQGTSQTTTASNLFMLGVNDFAFLETTRGSLLPDNANNTSLNSFFGILLVGEQNNPYIQSLFNNNANRERSLQSEKPDFI